MTISCTSASRKYLERSSFTTASATSLGTVFADALFVKPRLGVGFRDDREDLDLRFSNVIEHPDMVDAQSILRLTETTQSLDAALAHLVGSCVRCFLIAP